MGLAKRAMEDAWERGHWASGEVICATHVSDPFLASIGRTGNTEECVVCKAVPDLAIDLDDLMDAVFAVVRCYWGRALDDLYFDRESEHGFAFPGDVQMTYELVGENFYGDIDFEVIEVMGPLWTDDEQWYDRSVLWLEGRELLSHSWKIFAEWARNAGDGEQPPEPEFPWIGEQADGIALNELLPRLADLVTDLDLVREDDRVWHRARHMEPGEAENAATLGSVPAEKSCRPNRMSRVGDSMFYGAADADTAVAEVAGIAQSGQRTVVGEWRSSRPLRMLDLTRLPEVPSFYDAEHAETRGALLFLVAFSDEVSREISPDDWLPEYRPTQRVGAHFRDAVPHVDGVIYKSSLTGKPCCAVFATNEQCVDAGFADEPGLTLVLERKYER